MRRRLVATLVVVASGGLVAAVAVAAGRTAGEGPAVVVVDAAPGDGPAPLRRASTTTTTVPTRVVDHRLVAVGDSVLQGAARDLVDELDDWELVLDTRVGRFLGEGVQVAKRRRGALADVALVGLGNNYGGDEVAFAAEVGQMLEALAPVDHVLWLTVAEFRPDRREVNRVLRAAAARDPRLVLVDWNRLWRTDPSLTAGDRLHLTPAGAGAMAELVARTLRAAGLRPTPGAGRAELRTAGTLPRSAAGAVGDALDDDWDGADPDRDATAEVAATTAPPAEVTTTSAPDRAGTDPGSPSTTSTVPDGGGTEPPADPPGSTSTTAPGPAG